MKFTSTRDASTFFSFEEALCSGYAPDGGLFVPTHLPAVTPATLQHWSTLSYVELATAILSPFLVGEDDDNTSSLSSSSSASSSNGSIPREDLQRILRRACAGFADAEKIVPVVTLTPNQLYVAELFHGPTFCFKDLGMRATIFLLDYFASRRHRQRLQQQQQETGDTAAPISTQVTLVVSTTGDTGPAALQAVNDVQSDHLGILVHYPMGQISDFQRKQLTTVQSPRVKVVAFEGGGDDMDIPIKNIMTSSNSSDRTTNTPPSPWICGVNSYNIGRPLMQMVHFIWSYLRVAEAMGKKPGDPTFTLDIVIPTGAMGNIVGAYMAKKMGVPLGFLCAGVNINDITNTVFQTGEISKTTEPMQQTLSDAINIQLPYNLERLLFYLTDGDHALVKKWYQTLEESPSGHANLTNEWLEKLQQQFKSARITDDELCLALQDTLHQYNYWADPHTGVAFAAAKKLGYLEESKSSSRNPVALMATASPCKFQASMTTALGKSKWGEYEKSQFPENAKKVLQREEGYLIYYKANPDCSLEENQVEWEKMARDLIAEL